MEWVFRIFTLLSGVGFTAIICGGLAVTIFNLFESVRVIALPVAAVPICFGLYVSWQIIASCLKDDRL
jgi:hypothetical protein